jgi:hypothetical protein
MTTHYNHLSKRAACGRASARTTADKSKVTCIACRRTVAYTSKK